MPKKLRQLNKKASKIKINKIKTVVKIEMFLPPKEVRVIIMKNDKIIIRGARENNLKNIDLDLPKNSLIVMTGVSG